MNILYKIHKEGYPFIIPTFLIAATSVFVFFYFFKVFPLWFNVLIISVSSVCCVLLLFFMYFFRVPYRKIKQDENAILSPADGKIIDIIVEEETEYFKDKRRKISIFMSPLNVHVNSYPIDGEVTYVKYHPGKHLIANLPKASKENEHNTVVQKHKNGEKILFRQIAGKVARRIVSYAKKNDAGEQGNAMGIIRFGSRVDVFVPLSAKINVSLGEKVTSKITHLAYFS